MITSSNTKCVSCGIRGKCKGWNICTFISYTKIRGKIWMVSIGNDEMEVTCAGCEHFDGFECTFKGECYAYSGFSPTKICVNCKYFVNIIYNSMENDFFCGKTGEIIDKDNIYVQKNCVELD